MRQLHRWVAALTNHNQLKKSLIKILYHASKTFTIDNCKRRLTAAAHQLRKLKLEGEDISQLLDNAVSLEADWQKRYGLNSLKGNIINHYRHGLCSKLICKNKEALPRMQI